MSIPLPLSKAYFEISNVCNASCAFCPGNKRQPRFVSEEEFRLVLQRLKGRVQYLYFHVMGEPLCHPYLCRFAELAANEGFRVMITSNGLLAETVGLPLLETGAVYKISLSLHSYEANAFGVSLNSYLDGCFRLAEVAAGRKTICALRLWNQGPNAENASSLNAAVLSAMRLRFGDLWHQNRCGYRLKPYLFLEWGERFLWPGQAPYTDEALFCHALRSQIGILSDGTVVPCCLDGEGRMPLGNIFSDTLESILSSSRAERIYNGFTSHIATEKVCRTCGYARRFVCHST